MRLPTPLFLSLLCAVPLAIMAPSPATAQGTCCVLPDNGTGTADLPPNCPTGYNGPMNILDGLQPLGTIQIQARLFNFFNVVQGPGGGLGGTRQTWSASLVLNMVGTGTWSGYVRTVVVPVVGETHSAPRIPFATPQSFNEDLYTLQGQLPPGDPDFDLLRITAGDGFGLPSPGHTIFSASGGGWAVESFFDVTYRIDFIGRAAGPFGGRSGSTTGLSRMELCPGATPAHASTWGQLKSIYR